VIATGGPLSIIPSSANLVRLRVDS